MSEILKDKSVGVIPILAIDGQYKFLLVLHHQGHWSFPKGHPEEGENEIMTAKRELQEETGISRVKIDENSPLVETYTFDQNGLKYEKTVKYFPGLVDDDFLAIPRDFQAEILEAGWFDYQTALEKLTFPEAKDILRKVFVYLNNKI